MTANLLGIPETRLPEDPSSALLADARTADDLEAVVRANPSSPLAWALLSDLANGEGRDLDAYAYARVGYHRGLDALRRAGWRGQGPVPWSHEPNRGVLRSLYALRRGAQAIGETEEVARLTEFLQGADPAAIPAIEAHAD